MNGDNSGKRLLIIGGAVLLGIAVVNNAYEAGLRAGLAGSGRGPATDIDGWGHVPFPPVPLILLGLLAFWAYRRGAFGGPRHGRGGHNGVGHGLDHAGRDRGFGSGQPPQIVMEWHRRLHEAERQQQAQQYQQPANVSGAGSAPSASPTSPAPPPPPAAPGTGSGTGGNATNV